MGQEFEYDGVDLNTLGYNVRLLGAPLSVPGRRGDNLVIPHKPGRAWVAKHHDQRIVTLAMFVLEKHPTTGVRSEANLLANLDTLRGLFARDGQRVLKHKIGTRTLKATAEVVNTVEFEPQGKLNVYSFVVEFLLADPWWYAESATTVGPTALTQSPQSITVTNAGSRRSEKAVITITYGIVNPKLQIGAYWVQWTGSVTGTLVLDCGAFTAKHDGVDVSGLITHEGGTAWLPIEPGANTLTVSQSSGPGGTVKVVFSAPYV